MIPVHLFGQAAEMDPILEIASRHGLIVIEDAAQAIGSEYKGRRVGSFGQYGCFSFFPSKNLGCFGDGGMVTADSPERVEKLKIFRNHEMNPKYYHKYVGRQFPSGCASGGDPFDQTQTSGRVDCGAAAQCGGI